MADQIKLEIEERKQWLREDCKNRTHIPGYCPPVITELLDSIYCWDATPNGTIATAPCPKLEHFLPNERMHKTCWSNGTWFIHPDTTYGDHWTNYTSCFSSAELEFHQHINRLMVIGYSISLVALVISVIIFLSFRTLKCTRIRLHIQLFVAFIMNCIMWLIWYCEVIPTSVDLNDDNPLWCDAVEILLKYFLISTYMWMFCEGLYLYISLVVVFVRDNIAWIWFLLIGWGIPFVIVTAYAIARIHFYNDTKNCWLEPSPAALIYSIPVWITIGISIIFLFYVMFVIVNIMNPTSGNPAPLKVKRAARALLILIPLFDLHYLFIPFRPEPDAPYARLYEYVTVVIASLQGLCVSTLFCFANQDVHQEVARCLRRRLSIAGWSRYATGAGVDNSGGVFMINSSGNRTSIRIV